jgi:hypothetical protein
VRLRFLVQVPTDLFMVKVLFGQLSSARIANRLASLSLSLFFPKNKKIDFVPQKALLKGVKDWLSWA